MNGLDKEKLLQVSVDSPNVNTKFLLDLNEERWDQELSQFVSIANCGIHTVHNAFKNGKNASHWKLKMLLSSLFEIFHESPSRRADYELLTEVLESDYPLKFCSHQWVENEDVAKCAKAVWHKIVTITEFWVGLPKSKQLGLGQCEKDSSYDNLHNCYKDPLIPVKFQFFEEMAKSLNKFLLVFQTDKRMAAFLAETLEQLLLFLLQVCQKGCHVKSINSLKINQDRP